MGTKETITQAITEKRLLQFYYDGGTRVVEPHQLAYNEATQIALSAYWVGGYSETRDTSTRWREYLIDQMSAVVLKEESFAGPRPGYKRTPNKKFSSAIAQI